MKKLLLTAASAILGISAANAQAVDVKVGANIEGKTLTKATELVNGHHYLIWDDVSGRTGYHYPASLTDIQKDRTEKTAYSPDYVWTVETVTGEDGSVSGYKLFNEGYQAYMTKLTHGGNTGVNGDAPAVFTFTQTDGTFSFTDTTSGEMWKGNPDNLAGWGGAHTIYMYDLAENDAAVNYYPTTYNGTIAGYYAEGTTFTASSIFEDAVVNGPTALVVKQGLKPFKFVSARLGERWATTNANGVTTSTRDEAEWFVEIPGEAANELKMFSINKNAWLLAPTNSANPTAVTENEAEAAVYTRERTETGAETFFSNGNGFNIRNNNVAGWSLTDIGSYWFQVYDDEAYDTNIAYYAYNVNPNTYSTAISDAQAIVEQAEASDEVEVTGSAALANLKAGIAAAEAARFGEPGLKAAVDALASLQLDVMALLGVPDEDVDVVIAAGDYIANTLDFGNADDKAAWNTAKAVTKPLSMAKYAALCDAYNTLLTNACLHIPAEGKHVMFRHPQRPALMGVYNGNIQRGGDEGTTTFTLKPADGGFTIFNEYAGGYLKHPAADTYNVTLVQNEDEATVYTLDRQTIGLASDVTTYNFGIKANGVAANRAYLHSNSAGNDRTNVVRWEQNRQSSWYVELSNAETAANEYLEGAKVYYDGMTFGTGVGEYSITAAGQAAAEAAKTVGTDASIADKRAAGDALRNPATALNMPQVGHVYMFSKVDGSKYMSCENMTDAFATMVEPTDENLVSRLFYLDEDHHLVALKDGKVMGAFLSTDKGSEGHSWTTVLVSNTDKAGVFTFSEAATHGKYVIAAQGNNRNMYNDHADVDCGGAPTAVGYHWTIEDKGEWVPVSGTENDHTTLCLPYAVYTRGGMTVYTAKVSNGKVVPELFESNVIPANTPVIVDFDGVERDEPTGLVYLQRYYGEAPAAVEGNELLGSVYAFAPESPIALRSGNSTFAASTSEVVNGGQAYVNGGLHTYSSLNVETELDALVGKVFTIKNTDTGNNRGYLIYKEGTDAIWTSGKSSYSNDAADEQAPTNVNFHWTLVKENGNRYLYNVAAQKFAAAYVAKGNNVGQAEFVWHFSDYPTAVDFHFFDYEIAEDLASATFNIIGGENVGNNRPGGMMIINGNATHPVPAVAGNSANDGCGFTLSIVDGATAGDVASVSEALAAMEAEHNVAADYVANYDDALNVVPGHFTAEGYEAFSAALAGTHADAQAKYYALIRARQAAADKVNTFANGEAYRLTDGEGNQLVAKLEWIGPRYLTSTEVADGTEDDIALNWLCTIDEEGNVEFTHGFEIDGKARPYEGEGPAAVRARVAAGAQVVNHSLAEAAAASYDGLGNIKLGELALKSSSSLGADAETTAISEITAKSDAEAGAAYDLQGRRVNGSAKGLLIINGQKTYRK